MCKQEKPCDLAMFCMAGTRAVIYVCPVCKKAADGFDSYPPINMVFNCDKSLTVVYGRCITCFAKKVVWQEEE